MPQPQVVRLGASDFVFSRDWKMELQGVAAGDAAVEVLNEELERRFHLKLVNSGRAAGTLRLVIAPNSAKVGEAQDRDRDVLAQQAYKIDLSRDRVTIAANAPAGLYYGVVTFVQLLKPRDGALLLPEGQIEDWPDLQIRQLYWDDAHHLDRLESLKQAIRQAAFFKINGFALKLEGHFQYRSAPALVEPYALSPAQYQELTDYGLRYHVQLIPYLDGPGHIAFILKHPEYAGLREYPESNYELCATNPDSYKLLFGMFQDLLDANKGVKYFYLSTDEPYYVGLAEQRAMPGGGAREGTRQRRQAARGVPHQDRQLSARPRQDRGVLGRVSAEARRRRRAAAAYRERRNVWSANSTRSSEARNPADDLQLLAGRREDVSGLLSVARFPPAAPGPARAPPRLRNVSEDHLRSGAEGCRPHGRDQCRLGRRGSAPGDLLAGLCDRGRGRLASRFARPGGKHGAFYPLFYGPARRADGSRVPADEHAGAILVRQLGDAPSKARKPIWGNSNGPFDPPRPARDQSIPLPPVPAADLELPLRMGGRECQAPATGLRVSGGERRTARACCTTICRGPNSTATTWRSFSPSRSSAGRTWRCCGDRAHRRSAAIGRGSGGQESGEAGGRVAGSGPAAGEARPVLAQPALGDAIQTW